ncbi:hypothetical protein VNO80_23150 [Phaseolus coccineus]|uniref:Uncharacterized protein n=1 Tax=Phaseolus coccineus TaxID=3886 RepID=A0AAN9QUZ6_PHACN
MCMRAIIKLHFESIGLKFPLLKLLKFNGYWDTLFGHCIEKALGFGWDKLLNFHFCLFSYECLFASGDGTVVDDGSRSVIPFGSTVACE